MDDKKKKLQCTHEVSKIHEVGLLSLQRNLSTSVTVWKSIWFFDGGVVFFLINESSAFIQVSRTFMISKI